MASNTTTVIPVRVPNDMLERIHQQVASSLLNRKEEPYTVSSYIVKAISEKLNHLDRSKKKGS
jgi:hypothetical protein